MRTSRTKSLTLAIISGISFLARINAMVPPMGQKSWTYEIKSVESESTQPDLFNIDLNVERVSRGIYSLSGTLTMDFVVVEGDDTEIEGLSYRSDNGVNEYKMLPFKMQKGHLFKFLNGYYKDMLMATLKDCSDLPVFEDKFEPPFERKTYTLDKCQFNQDGFPNHLKDGFYKIVIAGFGTVEWSVTIIVEVENKSYK